MNVIESQIIVVLNKLFLPCGICRLFSLLTASSLFNRIIPKRTAIDHTPHGSWSPSRREDPLCEFVLCAHTTRWLVLGLVLKCLLFGKPKFMTF
ncbi:hypothetical protein EMCRGX_G033551 [Ephydatia muelleri]